MKRILLPSLFLALALLMLAPSVGGESVIDVETNGSGDVTYGYADGKIVIKAVPRGSAELISMTVGGVDVTDTAQVSGGAYTFILEDTEGKVEVRAEFSTPSAFPSTVLMVLAAFGCVATAAVYFVRK